MLTHETTEPPARSDAETPAPDRARDRRWTILFLALMVLPLVISAIYLWFWVGDSYTPTVDWAIFEMQTRDVFRHGVWVGPYSRYGFNHPGPLLFYMLAVPYKLLGESSISMHITTLAVNAAAIVGIGWVAYRRGRLPIVLTVLVPFALMLRALGPDLLRNPWNPYIPVIPLLLLLLLAWSVAVGDLWMLPVAVAVASFTIQSHVGLAVESVAVLLVALVGIIVQWRKTEAPERKAWWRHFRRVVAVAGGVFVLLWLPVAYGTAHRRRRQPRSALRLLLHAGPREGRLHDGARGAWVCSGGRVPSGSSARGATRSSATCSWSRGGGPSSGWCSVPAPRRSRSTTPRPTRTHGRPSGSRP